MARALSSSRLNASTVAKSGRGAPSRMQTRDEGLGDVLARARHQRAGLLQLVDPGHRQDHHVGGLAGVELALERADGAEVERDLMAARPRANALPSAPTATCIERAHITLSLATGLLPQSASCPALSRHPRLRACRQSKAWMPGTSPAMTERGGCRVEKLSQLIKGPDLIVAPVALNPIMAQMAALAGFKAAYLSGGSLGWYKGVTEAGLSLTEMIQVVVDIRTVSQDPGGARRRRRLGRSGPHPPHHRHVGGGRRRVHRDRGPAAAAPGRAPRRHRPPGADRARRRPDQGGGRRPHQPGPADRRAHQRAPGRGHGRRAPPRPRP